MNLILRNLNHKFLEFRIKQCIALLGEEYQCLNYTITFYQKRGELIRESKESPDLKEETYKQILLGQEEAAGITLGNKKEIKIFLFLFGDFMKNPYELMNLIANIYHELRHAWQVENNLFQDEQEVLTLDENLETYYSLPSEKDAYIFQDKQMKKFAPRVLGFFRHKKHVNYELKPEISKIVYS